MLTCTSSHQKGHQKSCSYDQTVIHVASTNVRFDTISAMWLLNTQTVKLEAFLGNVPSYAILSHRWEDEELSFGDVTPEYQHLKGYRKVKAFCEEAERNHFQYVWVDTCCIDKKSSAELGEAINSMYVWYERADICYAYLCDVKGRDGIAQSSWFTRGWTLQELLAPTKLHFYDSEWSPIASKYELSAELEGITGIPRLALHKFRHDDFCIAEKMSWASRRQTTREEDSAYCLLGLFNVNMPLLYGEGSKAFLRFQEEIMKVSTDLSILLWQGRASPMNGMLAAAPSSFIKDSRNPLDLPRHKTLFNIPRGWTTNNAGTDLQLPVYPYLFTQDTNKIFLVCVHEVNRLWRAEYGIFLEELDGIETRATPSYRRVTVDGDAWIKIELPHQNAQRLGSRRQFFITRHAPVNYHKGDAIRGFHVALEFPLAATSTARYGLIADHYRALKDGPISSEVVPRKCNYLFEIARSTDLSLFGHVVITLAEGVEVLVGFGFDRTFCATCVVLPLCTKLYQEGLTAYGVSLGCDELTRVPDRHRGRGKNLDSSCEFFGLSCAEGFIESSEDLDRIGIHLKIDMDFYEQFQIVVRLDGEKFLRHYFPGQVVTVHSENTTLREDSIALQNKLDVARKRLLGWT
ncbi:hypothetical protein Q7P35_003327 [Cladosporium inversicolor]